jgi:saccharopine dehydrogenase-like NADP-dependent oxidoreductase
MEGLINEYAGDCTVLREGRRTSIPCLTEVEEITFSEPVGRAEAFITGGGISRRCHGVSRARCARYAQQGGALSWPHYAAFRAYRELGLFSEAPIMFDERPIVPRQLLFRLLRPLIDFPGDPGMCA